MFPIILNIVTSSWQAMQLVRKAMETSGQEFTSEESGTEEEEEEEEEEDKENDMQVDNNPREGK